MDAATMRADCARCAALCCVAPAFDRSQGFPFDKPNGVACPNLDCENRCRVYRRRAESGFGACVHYDCLGAGQHVTQEVFGGRSWRDEPDLLPDMVEAFFAMRVVHELVLLLSMVAAMPIPAAEHEAADRLMQELTPAGGWSAERLAAFESGDAPSRIRKFLVSLERHFEASAGTPATNRDRAPVYFP